VTFTPPRETDDLFFDARAKHVSGLVVYYDETNDKYHIWIGTNDYGLLHWYTGWSDWVQTEDPGEGVRPWKARALLMDPMETTDVSLFYGTWQAGLAHYTLEFSSGDCTWVTPMWGLYGGNGPGGRGGYLDSGVLPGTGDVLGSSYQHGLYKMALSGSAFSGIGNTNGTAREKSNWSKCFNDVIRGPETVSSIYYGGCRPFTRFAYPSGTDYATGGIYYVDATDNCNWLNADWHGIPNLTDHKAPDAVRMVKDPDGSFYVATGEYGINCYGSGIDRHVVRRAYLNGALQWTSAASFDVTNYSFISYSAPLGIDPYPNNNPTNHQIVVGIGNYSNWNLDGASPLGIGRIYGPDPDNSYQNVNPVLLAPTGSQSFYSFHDVEAMPRPSTPSNDDYVVFAAEANHFPPGKSQTYVKEGGIWALEVYTGTPPYTATDVTPPTSVLPYASDYGFASLHHVNYNNRMQLLAAIAQGYRLNNPDVDIYESIFLIGRVTNDSQVNWCTKGRIEIPSTEGLDRTPLVVHEIYGAEVGAGQVTFYLGGGSAGMVKKSFDNLNNRLDDGGWHWISANYYQCFDSLADIMVTCDSLIEMRDQYRNRYAPLEDPPVDSIYVWTPLKGYAVRISGSDEFESFGDPIPADTTLVLLPAPQDSAWIYNYVAYLPADTLTALACFEPDSDYVIIVKNDDGQFWRPVLDEGVGFYMVPGEGYQVGVNDTLEYQYPSGAQAASLLPKGPETPPIIASATPTHFQFTSRTIDYYPLYIEELLVNGQPPAVGDEVGVFTPADLCVGAGVFEGAFPIKLAAWKDDPCTEAVDGYTAGQTMNFKLYDASEELEIPLEMGVTVQSAGNGNAPAATSFERGFYAQHSLNGSYLLPGRYRLAQNYPNPFNPATTIRYDLPFASNVTLEIFDVAGRKVVTLVDGVQAAGFRMARWNGRNAFGGELASGVYFCRLKAQATAEYLGKKHDYEYTLKMVMVK